MALLRALATGALGATLCASLTAAAQDVEIETYRRGDTVTVWAEANLQVDLRVAWDVLSDYDHMSQFIPNLTVSRVISRNANSLVVEQKGEFAFLFFRQPIEVRMDTVETPRSRIVAHAIAGGSFRELSGRYELQNLEEGGVRITYMGRFVPAFPLPPFLGIIAVRNTASTQFAAMMAEIRRRDSLAKERQPNP
jgi:ribosome-associated toxin RatA of RatAB toxin-antitoxin module